MRRFLKKEALLLIAIFLFLILIRIPVLIRAYVPTIRWDEYIYMYNAKALSNYSSPETYLPTYSFEDFNETDSVPSTGLINHYPPFASLIQSLAFLPNASSFWIYRFILILNAIVIATIAFPLYQLARGIFPRQNPFLLVLLSATSISILGKSSWAMSEAIFIPLFVWILYFAWRLYQEDKLVDFLFYGLTIGLLIITREQALAFIPISVIHYLFVSLIKKEGARPLRLLLLVALTGTPVLLWQIINVQTGTRVESFLEGGVTSLFSSLPNVVVYFQNWVRQLDYLYFGSFFLLIPLLTYTAGRVKSVNSLLRNPSFHLTSLIFLMALGLIFPSTLLMTKAQLYHPNPAKYLMYGRYIDVLIPLIIFFGIGVVGKRINLGRKKVFFILSTLLIVGANLTFPWHAYYNFYWFANKSAVFWVPNVGDQPLYLLLFIIFQVSISAVALFLQARSRKKAVMIFLFLVLIGNTVNLWKNVDIFLKRQDPSGKPLIALQSFIEESNDRIYISKEDLTSSPLIRNYLFFLSHNFYQDKIKFIESCKEIINKQGCLLTKEVMKREALGEYHFGAENYYLYCYDNFTCQ